MKGKRLTYLLTALALAALVCIAIQAVLAGDAAKYPQEGDDVRQDGKLQLDVSNVSEGYFLARVSSETSKRLKMRVVTRDTTLDYDVPGTCEYIVVPLQMGSGSYKVSLYENASGNKYAAAGSLTITAELEREDGAFLYPNQYVNYTAETPAVLEADLLCAGKSEQEAFEAVCAYMKTFTYDFVKAVNIKAGMLPDIDDSWEKKMGVCQDLASIMCCMLRTQGIPSRLVIGYADGGYHAWTQVTVNGEDIFYDPTAEIPNMIKPRQYTVERFY